MDREYFLVSFVIAAAVATVLARVAISRIDAWLLIQREDEPRARLILLAAVVVLLWVTVSLVSQIVSGASLALTQWFLDVDNFFERDRVRAVSINSGISAGTQVGLAFGLVEYAVRALMQVRALTAADEDGADAGEDWSRPSQE